MSEKTPIMQAAEKAARIVAAWSKSKQAYADRVVNQQLQSKEW